MALKFSVCAAILALAHASPVPYSTEQNYGSSLSATTEAGWSGKQAPPLDGRGALSASEQAQTESFIKSLFSHIGVSHAENSDDAARAILSKVEAGKSTGAGKRDVKGEEQQQQQDTQTQAPKGSWWDSVKGFFQGGKKGGEAREEGQLLHLQQRERMLAAVHDLGQDSQDNERMVEVNQWAGQEQQGQNMADCDEEHVMKDGTVMQGMQ